MILPKIFHMNINRVFQPLKPFINLIEVGPRDGLQNESKCLPVSTKVDLIRRLTNAGVINIEAGSFVNYTKVPQMQGTNEVIRGCKHFGDNLSVLIPHKSQVKNIDEGVNELVFFVSASNTFNQKNINTDIEGAFKRFYDIKKELEEQNKTSLSIRGSISCCWGCPYEGKVEEQAIKDVIKRYEDLGVDMIDICDTIGNASSETTELLLSKINSYIPFSLHLHDTNGKAIESALVGVKMGIQTLQSSIAGLGGCPFSPKRAGNVDSVKLVRMLHAEGYDTGINVDELEKVGDWIKNELK
jgi:hydroxymethylglutaryl-CoA lyase